MKAFWMLSILVVIVVTLASVGYVISTNPENVDSDDRGITIPTTTGPPTSAEAWQIAAAS